MSDTIKAGEYRVEIVFRIDNDTTEYDLDSMFENAMYRSENEFSCCEIGWYKPEYNYFD